MTVYTVQSIDDLKCEPFANCIIGSYTSRGRALDECVGYIMERIGARQDLVRSMTRDYYHPDVYKFFVERQKDGVIVVRRGCVRKLRDFLRDELGRKGCYYVWDGESNWRFDIDENDVVGELWHTVTWGDSDCEDPQFTTPWPETFTSEDTAIKTFVNYAKDLMASQEMEIPEDFYALVEQQLDEDGKCQVDLDDGTSVSCVLYRDDAKNMRE